MEGIFSDRIEVEIRRGNIASLAAHEAAQLERWMVGGAPMPENPAHRFKDDVDK